MGSLKLYLLVLMRVAKLFNKNMQPALEINGINKSYGSFRALVDIDLRVEQGEFFALLGPNGAGKTTLISILAGLCVPDSGGAFVMGSNVVDDYQRSRLNLGVVPQELVYDPFFTVREMLSIQSGYFGFRRNHKWLEEITDRLGLASKMDENMRTLSGGMKRRVLVAQALVHKPPVIILDEPTAGVDVELRKSLWDFMKHLNSQGHTIVLTTHYLEEAEVLCERVGMLKEGRLAALDTTRNLLKRFSGIRLSLEVNGKTLPEALQKYLCDSEEKNEWVFRLSDYSEVEVILAEFRRAKQAVTGLDLREADLEDVFFSVIKDD